MEFVLAILGIIIGFLGLRWVSEPFQRAVIRFRALWTAKRIPKSQDPHLERARAVADGRLIGHYKQDFFFCDEYHRTLVDADGGITRSLKFLVVNISAEPKDRINFQVNTSSKDSDLNLWCKIKGVKHKLQPRSFDPTSGVGDILINFPKPLHPGEDLWVEYGYKLSGVYEPGENWWGWYIGNPMGLLRLCIVFHESWHVSGLREELLGEGYLVKGARLKGNEIRWTIKAPVLGVKYRLHFELQKRGFQNSNDHATQ